jgi:hypothetical protein
LRGIVSLIFAGQTHLAPEDKCTRPGGTDLAQGANAPQIGSIGASWYTIVQATLLDGDQ